MTETMHDQKEAEGCNDEERCFPLGRREPSAQLPRMHHKEYGLVSDTCDFTEVDSLPSSALAGRLSGKPPCRDRHLAYAAFSPQAKFLYLSHSVQLAG